MRGKRERRRKNNKGSEVPLISYVFYEFTLIVGSPPQGILRLQLGRGLSPVTQTGCALSRSFYQKNSERFLNKVTLLFYVQHKRPHSNIPKHLSECPVQGIR